MLKQVISAEKDIQEQALGWQKQDTVWMLSLYGTAIGAGVLFLPINAGLNGFLPLVIMLLIAFFISYFPHQALCRFVLSGDSHQDDITTVFHENFNNTVGKLLTFIYFFTIYPILLLYSVAITNTTESFLINQLGIQPPPRILLSILLILGLMAIVHCGQQTIIKVMSLLVYPFITILVGLSFYLIPYWNGAAFKQDLSSSLQLENIGLTLWLIIPVMVFSFNHSSIISAFALDQKKRYGESADKKSSSILKYANLTMVLTVMFFVFSCVLSLSPEDLQFAKSQNITILSYLANHFHNPVIAYLSPIIAFIAIAKSFFGHYLGAHEGLSKLVSSVHQLSKKSPLSEKKLFYFNEIFIILSCWIAATLNPSILRMIESLIGPVIATLLFLMPMYAIAKVPKLKKYRNYFRDSFVICVGILATSALIYGLIF